MMMKNWIIILVILFHFDQCLVHAVQNNQTKMSGAIAKPHPKGMSREEKKWNNFSFSQRSNIDRYRNAFRHLLARFL